MPNYNLIVKVPRDSQNAFLSLIRPEEAKGHLAVRRVFNWRSSGIPYTEIFLTLASAGSLTAIANIIKAWLARTRGKIEVVSEETGTRISFEGPLDKLPLDWTIRSHYRQI